MPGFGSQLIVPTGYRGLAADRTYFYFGQVGERAEVLLCSFDNLSTSLECLGRTDFEEAIAERKLVLKPKQSEWPEWLMPAIKRSSDPKNKFEWEAYKSRHEAAVDKRLARIKPLLSGIREILESTDPIRSVGRFARSINANAGRVVHDFFTFVAFRENKWALLPQNFLKGSPLITDEADTPKSAANEPEEPKEIPKKRGPKHKARGPDYGWAMTDEMREKCYLGYEKYRGLKQHLSTIWRKTLVDQFGCSTRKRSAGRSSSFREFYHPHGKPFPTEDQFYNCIHKHFGSDQVAKDKYGEQKTRNTRRASRGSFTAAVANAHEQVYSDAYSVSEIPRGERAGNPMPPLWVTRIRDAASGMTLGIGFSLGAETSSAYREALFCAAIPKSHFGRLIGMEMDDSDWPTFGLPSGLCSDRGPGAKSDLLRSISAELTYKALAPSYAGQSQTVIESSHPKSVETSGPPTYVLTDITYTELMKREVLRCIRDNRRMKVSDRLTPEMKEAGVEPTPLAVFNYLDSRFRNDAHLICFDDAVRNLLEPINATATSRGIEYYGSLFNSPALQASGLLDRAVGGGRFVVPGFQLSMCVRQLWIEVQGAIIECAAQLLIRSGPDQLTMSVHELRALSDKVAKAEILARESRHAVDAYTEEQFRKETGHDWGQGKVLRGRAKNKTAASKEELKAIKKVGGIGR